MLPGEIEEHILLYIPSRPMIMELYEYGIDKTYDAHNNFVTWGWKTVCKRWKELIERIIKNKQGFYWELSEWSLRLTNGRRAEYIEGKSFDLLAHCISYLHDPDLKFIKNVKELSQVTIRFLFHNCGPRRLCLCKDYSVFVDNGQVQQSLFRTVSKYTSKKWEPIYMAEMIASTLQSTPWVTYMDWKRFVRTWAPAPNTKKLNDAVCKIYTFVKKPTGRKTKRSKIA